MFIKAKHVGIPRENVITFIPVKKLPKNLCAIYEETGSTYYARKILINITQ